MNQWLYQKLAKWLDNMSDRERNNLDYEKFSRYADIEDYEANEYFKFLANKGLFIEKIVTQCPNCREECSIDLSLYGEEFECTECENIFNIKKMKRHSSIVYKLNRKYEIIDELKILSQFKEDSDNIIDISKIRGHSMINVNGDIKIKVFLSYSHEDESMKEELDKHLIMLKRNDKIESWNDRCMMAGQELDSEIQQKLESSDVIVLLLSPDFLVSNYCYEKEMKRALEKHDSGETLVIPIILRTCDWLNSPLKKLLAVPKDGKPINTWDDKDQVYHNVKQEIEKSIDTYFSIK